jgi:Xaa-Pro aminopeptidase
MPFYALKMKLLKCLSRNTLETVPYRVGKLMTSELLGLGLLDKADVQNESPEKPAYKNISCTEHRTTWD